MSLLRYSRDYFLEKAPRMVALNRLKAMIYSADQMLFCIRREGEVVQPAKRGEVVFTGSFRHRHRNQQVFLALVETASLGGRDRSPGLGISIDLQTGLIMDLLNDQGVLGYVPWDLLAPHREIPFRLEMDVIGRVCVPRLVLGNEILLHPSLYLETRGSLSALTGTSLHPLGDAQFSEVQVSSQLAGTEICVA